MIQYNCDNNGENTYGVYEKYDGGRDCVDYWAYGLKPTTLKIFFDRIVPKYSNILRHKFGDMVLSMFLIRLGLYHPIVCIQHENESGMLYKYNIQNPNSICYQIQNNKKKGYNLEGIKNDLYLACAYRNFWRVKCLIHMAKDSDRRNLIFYSAELHLFYNYLYKDNVDLRAIDKAEDKILTYSRDNVSDPL